MSDTFEFHDGDTSDWRRSQRWRMPEFGAPPEPEHDETPAAEPEPPPGPPPPTVEEIEAIEAAAWNEGYARGQEEGLAAAAAEIARQFSVLQGLIGHLALPLSQLDEEVEGALVKLATRIGTRLALHELSLEPARMQTLVHEAIATLAVVPREVRVLLNPEDESWLRDRLELPPDVKQWRLIADPGLQRGDCRIATDNGWVDATLNTRLDGIVRAMLEAPVQDDSAEGHTGQPDTHVEHAA